LLSARGEHNENEASRKAKAVFLTEMDGINSN